MKNNLHKTVGNVGNKLIKASTQLAIFCSTIMPALATSGQLSWKGGGSTIETWFNTILLVIMGVFVMTACIMGSLAFKQLAFDGNWKDFWSKIAGAVGMFIVPIAIYWVKDQS